MEYCTFSMDRPCRYKTRHAWTLNKAFLFCHCHSPKWFTYFSDWSFSAIVPANSMTVIALGMSMKCLTSLAIKCIFETKPTMSWSKSFRFNCWICWVWSSYRRKCDFWLQLCDGISCHGMLGQILWTAMFIHLIVKIEKKMRNMGREQFISIVKDVKIYVLWSIHIQN